jgi:Flp pilus assembly pilin Flp
VTSPLITLHIRVSLLLTQHSSGPRRLTDERGQATTEYALVLLAAALVGLMVVGWATAGSGAERIGRLFNSVIDSVIDRV